MSLRLPLAWIGWMLLGAVLALPVLAWQGNWFDAGKWPIRNLRVESEAHAVSVPEIKARVAAHVGGGFFAVDLAEVRAAVMANPWVERVEVRRQFPDRLVLRIDERRPVASFGDGQLLSSRGELFDVAPSHWPEGLPRLDGPEDERARLFNFWQEANQKFAGVALPVVAARMSDRGAYVLELATGCELLFARQAGTETLDRFLVSLAAFTEIERERLARVDLRYANGYVVVWKPAEVAPPVQTPDLAPTTAAPPAPVVPEPAPAATEEPA